LEGSLFEASLGKKVRKTPSQQEKKKKKKPLGVVMHTCHPSRKLKNEGFVVWAGLGKK
jgi:hypothetical protein